MLQALREVEKHDMQKLILNFRSWSCYPRSSKIGWCRLTLRLGKGYLPNGEKSANRSDLITILYGFLTKQVSTTLSSKHLAVVNGATLPPEQEYWTSLLRITLGICNKDGNKPLLSLDQRSWAKRWSGMGLMGKSNISISHHLVWVKSSHFSGVGGNWGMGRVTMLLLAIILISADVQLAAAWKLCSMF